MRPGQELKYGQAASLVGNHYQKGVENGGLVENGPRGFYKHILWFSQHSTHPTHASHSYAHIVSLVIINLFLSVPSPRKARVLRPSSL